MFHVFKVNSLSLDLQWDPLDTKSQGRHQKFSIIEGFVCDKHDLFYFFDLFRFFLVKSTYELCPFGPFPFGSFWYKVSLVCCVQNGLSLLTSEAFTDFVSSSNS